MAPFGILPLQEYGKPVVVVTSPSDATQGQMPLLAPGVAKITQKTVEQISGDGVLTGTTTTNATGPYAITLRSIGLAIQTLGSAAAAKLLASLGYQGADGSFTQDPPLALTPTHTITGTFKAPGWSDPLNKGVDFFIPGGLRVSNLSGDGIMGSFNPPSPPPPGPGLCFSAEAQEDISLTVPAGWNFKVVPKDVRVETPNLLFVAHWSLDKGTITVHRDFTSKIDQAFCSDAEKDRTDGALKQIRDSYNVTLSLTAPQGDIAKSKNEADNQVPPDVAAAYQSGASHLESKQFDLAVKDFDKEISLAPNDAAGYENRGLAHFRLNELDDAISDFTRAIDLKPDFETALQIRGEAYVAKHDYPSGIADFSKAIELDPGDASNYNDRGWAYRLSGQFDLAQPDLNKAIALKSDYPQPYFNLGYIYLNQKKFSDAVTAFDQAIKLSPAEGSYYDARARAHGSLNQWPETVADSTEALKLNSKDTNALFIRAYGNLQLHQYAQVIADCDALIATDANAAPAFLLRGNAKNMLGRTQDGNQDIATAVRLNPEIEKMPAGQP
jgi:tetratricopeptide (TPR) repeat protein